MNIAAWAVLVPLVLTATLLPWIVGKLRLGGLTNDVRWLAGAVAVLCTVAAGFAARGTFIGADLVPLLADISEWTRIIAAVLFIAAAGFAFLAFLPDRWVSVSADQRAAVAGFVAPLLAPYAAWGLGTAAGGLLTFLASVGAPVVDVVTQR